MSFLHDPCWYRRLPSLVNLCRWRIQCDAACTLHSYRHTSSAAAPQHLAKSAYMLHTYGSTTPSWPIWYSISNPASQLGACCSLTSPGSSAIELQTCATPLQQSPSPYILYINHVQPYPMWLHTGQPCHTPRAHGLNKHPRLP